MSRPQTDIVDKLRRIDCTHGDAAKAANEIERLQSELEARDRCIELLRAALNEIADVDGASATDPGGACGAIARKALKEIA